MAKVKGRRGRGGGAGGVVSEAACCFNIYVLHPLVMFLHLRLFFLFFHFYFFFLTSFDFSS